MDAEPLVDLEAERHLVGVLVLWPEKLIDVQELIVEDDFWLGPHAEVFSAVCSLECAGTPVRPDSIMAYLGAPMGSAKGDVIGRVLEEAMVSVSSAAHALYHARRVADLATLRRVQLLGREVEAEASEVRPTGKDEASDFLESVESRLFAISESRPSTGEVEGVDRILQALVETLEADTPPGFPSGIEELDYLQGGLRPAEMTILAARPSVGKTAFALQVAANVLSAGKAVLLLSLEMSNEQLMGRMVAGQAGVRAKSIRDHRLTHEDREKLKGAVQDMKRWRLSIANDTGTTPARLRTMARRTMARGGLDLVIVDYLQLMTEPTARSRVEEVTKVSKSLKALGKELGIPVLAVSQLNRGPEDAEPQLHHLRDSGAIEQDADAVIFLWRDDPGVACKLAKNRNGAVGGVPIVFDRELQRVRGTPKSMVMWGSDE